MKQYQGVIFDLDGTLLNTLDDLRNSMNTVLDKYGFPAISYEEAAAYLGNGSEVFLRKSLKTQLPEIEFKRYLEEYKSYYNVHMGDMTHPYKGVEHMLISLQKQGIKTAVVSNKFDQAVKGLCRKYFSGLLDFAIGEGNGLRPKPAGDMLEKIVQHMGISLQDCIYIGDTEVDLATAEAAQMPCISVTWGFRTREQLLLHGAEVIVDDVSYLESFLLRQNHV